MQCASYPDPVYIYTLSESLWLFQTVSELIDTCLYKPVSRNTMHSVKIDRFAVKNS